MKRRLFNVLALVSLVLFLASAGMWVRSTDTDDCIAYYSAVEPPQSYSQIRVWSHQRKLGIVGIREQPSTYQPPIPSAFAAQLGVSFHRHGYPIDLTRYMVAPEGYRSPLPGIWIGNAQDPGSWIAVHYWMLCTLTGLPPIYRLARMTFRRKFGKGRCTQCGYDLRASPERCPECGAEPMDQMAFGARGAKAG